MHIMPACMHGDCTAPVYHGGAHRKKANPARAGKVKGRIPEVMFVQSLQRTCFHGPLVGGEGTFSLSLFRCET